MGTVHSGKISHLTWTFTKKYWAVLGCTGLYWAVLGHLRYLLGNVQVKWRILPLCNVAARERRLRGEIARVRDNLILGDISNIVLVSGKEQLANGLTKATASNYEVLEIFQTGRSNSK